MNLAQETIKDNWRCGDLRRGLRLNIEQVIPQYEQAAV